jgi:hypothetical protein
MLFHTFVFWEMIAKKASCQTSVNSFGTFGNLDVKYSNDMGSMNIFKDG